MKQRAKTMVKVQAQAVPPLPQLWWRLELPATRQPQRCYDCVRSSPKPRGQRWYGSKRLAVGGSVVHGASWPRRRMLSTVSAYLTHVLVCVAVCVAVCVCGCVWLCACGFLQVYGLLPDGDTRRIQFRRTRTTDGSSGSWKRGRRRHHHSAGRHAHDLGAAHVMDSMSTIFSVPSAASANNVDVPGESVVVEMATTSGGHTGIARTAELAAEAPALDSPTLKEQVEANPALSTSVRGHIVRKGLPFGSALSQMMQVDFHETGASASSLDGDASPVEGTLGAGGSPSKQLMRQASIPEHQWVEYEGDSGNSSSSSSSSRKHNTRPVAAPMAPTPAPACGDTNGGGGVVNPGGTGVVSDRGALAGGVEDVGTGSPHAPSPHDSPHPPRRRSVEELLVGPAAILCTSRERRAAQRKLEQRRSMAQAGADGDVAQAGAGVGRIRDDADTQEVRGAASTHPAALLASSPRKHRKKKHRRHKKKHRASKRRRGRGKDGGDREEEPSWTASEALRTAAFWTYSAAAFSIALTLTALYLHLEDVMAVRSRAGCAPRMGGCAAADGVGLTAPALGTRTLALMAALPQHSTCWQPCRPRAPTSLAVSSWIAWTPSSSCVPRASLQRQVWQLCP